MVSLVSIRHIARLELWTRNIKSDGGQSDQVLGMLVQFIDSQLGHASGVDIRKRTVLGRALQEGVRQPGLERPWKSI